VGAIWALVLALLALKTYLDRRTTKAAIDREIERSRSRG
jgi:hypothetical protein